MDSFINIIFSNANLPLTVLVIILVLYWLITMVLGVDFDVDFDVDIDADIDVTNTGIEGGNVDFQDVANTEVHKDDLVGNRIKPLKWWQVFLIYFNFVGLPFMFTFTCWVFIWWVCTTSATVITGSYNNSFGTILMLIGFFPSLFITKIATNPFKNFFKYLNKDGDKPIEIVGRTGVSLSSIQNEKLGSAEVKAEGAFLSINIKSLDGSPIKYRDPILVIKQSRDKSFYYAQIFNN